MLRTATLALCVGILLIGCADERESASCSEGVEPSPPDVCDVLEWPSTVDYTYKVCMDESEFTDGCPSADSAELERFLRVECNDYFVIDGYAECEIDAPEAQCCFRVEYVGTWYEPGPE